MKAPGRLLPLSLTVLLPFLLSVQGCSLIGLAIGAATDSGDPDTTIVTSWGIDSIKAGEDVTVFLKDGSKASGEFGGVDLDSLDLYNARYEKYLARDGMSTTLPPLGDTVFIAFKDGQVFSGSAPTRPRLTAYTYNGMYFTGGSGAMGLARYSRIDSLLYRGKVWSGPSLRRAVDDEQVPLQDVLVLQTEPPAGSRRLVPLSDVHHVYYEQGKGGALTGFLIGLAVDVVVVVVAATNASDDKPKTTTGQGSCPFVYSYDGHDYVLDSETFSGAITQSLQRTDWDNLDHLVDIGGVCSLRVENRLPETQYVDALKLHLVEHPQGTSVIADAPGVIHAVGQAHEPIEAVDYSGCVVTPLVRAGDSLAWISNPAGRDPDEDASVRDGLTVRFHRPADVGSARLVLTLCNTVWSTEIEERLLRLQGAYLDRWYDAMNDSPEFRDSFVEIVQREAMLSVQVWTGDTWQPVRFIPFPGPYVEKSYVVPLELQGLSGPELRVRLESTVGLWVINSITMDFSAPLIVRMTEAPVVRALDRLGNDLRQSLSSSDEKYHVLNTGDRLDLAFSVAPARPGYTRSFVLESAGYYTVHVTPSGSPQFELLQSFTDEPGAFGRYTLRIFHNWLHRELGALR